MVNLDLDTQVVEKDVGGPEWVRLHEWIEDADGSAVTIGLHKEDASREMVRAAVVNEFGHRPKNIPERRAHRFTFETKMADHVDAINEAIGRIEYEDLETTLKKIGIDHRKALTAIIHDWDDPPNKRPTIRKKGFDDPLIETGDTVNSMDYQLEDA